VYIPDDDQGAPLPGPAPPPVCRSAGKLSRGGVLAACLWHLACTGPNPAYRRTVGPVSDAASPSDAGDDLSDTAGAEVGPDGDADPDAAAGMSTDVSVDAAPIASADAPPVTSLSVGLIARYRLDPVGGNSVPDDSGASNGTAAGGVSWVAGFDTTQFSNGGALGLDGSSGYVLLPAEVIPDVSAETSISMWFWLAAPTTDFRRVLLSFNNSSTRGLQLGLEGGTPTVWAWNSAPGNVVVQAPVASPAGWTHVVYTQRAGSHALYLDGTLANSETFTYGSAATSQVLLGAFEPDRGEEERWSGRLDDLRIYDRVLTAQEIRALATGAP
jgi:hypothetical protein